jgi:hypothetical protein
MWKDYENDHEGKMLIFPSLANELADLSWTQKKDYMGGADLS